MEHVQVKHPKPPNFKPEPLFPPGHMWAGTKRCTAWSRNNGRQCNARALRGKTKCRYHGGGTPRGIASPHFEHGRHSKVMPVRLAASYEASLKDNELLALRSEISLIDARVSELIGKIDTGESGKLWNDLRLHMRDVDDFTAAANRLPNGDPERIRLVAAANESLNKVRQLIRRGSEDWMVWQDIHQNIELRRRLTESEQRRLVAMQTMVTSEQAMSLIGALTAAVNRYVTDRQVLGKIQEEFIRLSER